MINKKLAVVAALIAVSFSNPTFSAPVTQSTSPASADSYWYGNGWNWQTLGSVTLATGTNNILGLTSTATVVDQGWGGQDPNNGVRIGLFDNASLIWNTIVAGADHNWTTHNYDINNSPSDLSALEGALSTVNWSNTITLQMFTTPFAYPGWELHVQDASFSVTSDVPEPASLALLGLALAGLGAMRLKQKSA